MRLSVRARLDREAARNSGHDRAGREFECAIGQAPNVVREETVIPAAASLQIPGMSIGVGRQESGRQPNTSAAAAKYRIMMTRSRYSGLL